jgi:polyisoprenoid-binding protein YceI
MKTKLLIIICCFCLASARGQQLTTESGQVTFELQAPAGKLEAIDSNLAGAVDMKKGTIEMKVDVAGFKFVTATMPGYMNTSTTKRFHEYYMETKQYPQATYTGNIVNLKSFNYKRDGVYTIQTKGTLSMHGVSQSVTCKGKITVKEGKMYLDTAFDIKPGDYKIRKPASLGGLYFEKVKLLVRATLVKV